MLWKIYWDKFLVESCKSKSLRLVFSTSASRIVITIMNDIEFDKNVEKNSLKMKTAFKLLLFIYLIKNAFSLMI